MSETRIESDHVTMPLTDHNNFVYIGIFYIGSPGGSDSECQGEKQPIRMILDTGSANSWVLSNKAVDEGDKDHQPFDPSKSCGSTFHEPAEEDKNYTRISFGSGYLNGYFVEDLVTIGNVKSEDPHNKLILPEYTFGLVDEQTCF